MRPVEEIQFVTGRLVCWHGYDPSVKVDLSSHAFLSAKGWVLVDPIPLRDEPLAGLQEQKNVTAVILTNANHERAAGDYKQKCGVPIIAHSAAKDDLSVAVDQYISDGEEILGLKAIHLPGFVPGEIALYSAMDGLMMIGDAVINLESHGFALLPDKYCDAPRETRKSLQKLLQFPFEILTFAHGLPIVTGARQRLENLLQ